MSPMAPAALVMVVDDDPAVRAALACALEVRGFRVESFESAEDALGSPDLQQADCLVTDLRLPGADGFALIEAVRRRRPPMPIFMITTPTRQVCERAASAGVVLVEKPLLDDQLTEAVRRSLAA